MMNGILHQFQIERPAGVKREGKAALIVGAGQTPGPKMGNGRATALLFAREGATVLAADQNIA